MMDESAPIFIFSIQIMKSKPIKGLALLSFITLISAFLLYSAGYFDRNIRRPENNPEPVVNIPLENSNTSLNSINFVSDTPPEERFSSSKSIVIQFDRLSRSKKRAIRRDSTSTEKDIRMMSSSKSGLIFSASTFNIDSFIKKSDSQKIEKKKQE